MAKILGLDLGTNSIGWALIDDKLNKYICYTNNFKKFQIRLVEAVKPLLINKKVKAKVKTKKVKQIVIVNKTDPIIKLSYGQQKLTIAEVRKRLNMGIITRVIA